MTMRKAISREEQEEQEEQEEKADAMVITAEAGASEEHLGRKRKGRDVDLALVEATVDVLSPRAPLAGASFGLVGLEQLGNTCFLNGALQCLSHARPLTHFFLSNAFHCINYNSAWNSTK